MRTIRLVLLVAALFTASCSHYPTPYRSADGRVAYTTQVGGKWMHTINADGSMAFTGDNEISFQHLMQTAATLGTAYIGYLESLAQQVTDRFMAGQITLQQKNAALASIEQAKIAAGVSGATQFNPNIPLPIRQ